MAALEAKVNRLESQNVENLAVLRNRDAVSKDCFEVLEKVHFEPNTPSAELARQFERQLEYFCCSINEFINIQPIFFKTVALCWKFKIFHSLIDKVINLSNLKTKRTSSGAMFRRNPSIHPSLSEEQLQARKSVIPRNFETLEGIRRLLIKQIGRSPSDSSPSYNTDISRRILK